MEPNPKEERAVHGYNERSNSKSSASLNIRQFVVTKYNQSQVSTGAGKPPRKMTIKRFFNIPVELCPTGLKTCLIVGRLIFKKPSSWDFILDNIA